MFKDSANNAERIVGHPTSCADILGIGVSAGADVLCILQESLEIALPQGSIRSDTRFCHSIRATFLTSTV